MQVSRDDVLKILRATGATQWRLADTIGISEPTLTRWLRHPLEGERLNRVKAALNELREVD